MRPRCGSTTRWNSRSAATGSGKKKKATSDETAVKAPCSKGSLSADAWTIGARPPVISRATWTMSLLWSTPTAPQPVSSARRRKTPPPQPTARRAHERNCLGEEHAHRVAQCEGLLVARALDVDLRQGRGGQLDGGVQRQRRELLTLRLLHRLRLLLGELAQAAQQIFGIPAELKASAFHAVKDRD